MMVSRSARQRERQGPRKSTRKRRNGGGPVAAIEHQVPSDSNPAFAAVPFQLMLSRRRPGAGKSTGATATRQELIGSRRKPIDEERQDLVSSGRRRLARLPDHPAP